ncbi:MAG: hypothetical protein AAGJ94_14110, partial [Pseudomonadota bacterium]
TAQLAARDDALQVDLITQEEFDQAAGAVLPQGPNLPPLTDAAPSAIQLGAPGAAQTATRAAPRERHQSGQDYGNVAVANADAAIASTVKRAEVGSQGTAAPNAAPLKAVAREAPTPEARQPDVSPPAPRAPRADPATTSTPVAHSTAAPAAAQSGHPQTVLGSSAMEQATISTQQGVAGKTIPHQTPVAPAPLQTAQSSPLKAPAASESAPALGEPAPARLRVPTAATARAASSPQPQNPARPTPQGHRVAQLGEPPRLSARLTANKAALPGEAPPQSASPSRRHGVADRGRLVLIAAKRADEAQPAGAEPMRLGLADEGRGHTPQTTTPSGSPPGRPAADVPAKGPPLTTALPVLLAERPVTQHQIAARVVPSQAVAAGPLERRNAREVPEALVTSSVSQSPGLQTATTATGRVPRAGAPSPSSVAPAVPEAFTIHEAAARRASADHPPAQELASVSPSRVAQTQPTTANTRRAPVSEWQPPVSPAQRARLTANGSPLLRDPTSAPLEPTTQRPLAVRPPAAAVASAAPVSSRVARPNPPHPSAVHAALSPIPNEVTRPKSHGAISPSRATPQSPRPAAASARTHTLSASIEEILTAENCVRAASIDAGDLNGAVVLSGFSAGPLPRKDVVAALTSLPGVTSVDAAQLAPVASHCAVLRFLAGVDRLSQSPRVDAAPKTRPSTVTVAPRAPVTINFTAPEFPSYVLLDVPMPSGEVYHLDRSNWPNRLFRPGERAAFGAAGWGEQLSGSREPSLDLVMVVASSVALVPPKRPGVSEAQTYFDQLLSTMELAVQNGARIAVGVTIIETAHKDATVVLDAGGTNAHTSGSSVSVPGKDAP